MEQETQLRIYGCEVIQEGGILLKLPQAVMATGQVLLQRFYVKRSLVKFNIKVSYLLMLWTESNNQLLHNMGLI